jgi:phage portal protein BeeE
MKFTRDDILVAFGVPKSVLGISEDVNRANAETGMYVFLSEVIMPTMRDLLGKINEMLVSPDFGDNFYFDCEDLVPQNRDQVLKDYDSGLSKGWLTINDVRARENPPAVRRVRCSFPAYRTYAYRGKHTATGRADTRRKILR